MNRFVRSPAYIKTRAVTGAVFVLLGAILIVRTVAVVGVSIPAIAPLVMGIALTGLGAMRIRDYLRLRGRT